MGFNKDATLAKIHALFNKIDTGRKVSKEGLTSFEINYMDGLVSANERYTYEDGFYKKIDVLKRVKLLNNNLVDLDPEPELEPEEREDMNQHIESNMVISMYN